LSVLDYESGWLDQPFSLDPSGEGTSPYYLAESVTLVSIYVIVEDNPSALFQLHVE
jgi:hypothetical protein